MTMKFAQLILATLFVFSLASLSVKCSSPAEDDSQMEMMASLFKEMGLDKADNMTRENLRIILDKVLSKMYNQFYPHHVNFFKTVIEKYTMEVPESFPKVDIGKYLTQERLVRIMQESIKENYGEHYTDEMKSAFDEVNKSLNEGGDLQEEEDEEVEEEGEEGEEGQSPNLSGEGAIDQTPNQASEATNHSQNEEAEAQSPNLSGEGAVDQTPNQERSQDL